MSATDDLKTAFSGDRGKILLVGGGVVVVYLWWTRSRTSSAPQTDVVQAAPDGLHRTASAPSGETTAGPGANARPANNGEWQDRAVNILGGPPYNYSETAVYNAIAKAFLGEPISSDEENWIRAAMRALGSPPEGMPPLNIGAPPGNTQTPANAEYRIASGGNHVDQFAADYGLTVERLYALNPGIQASIGLANQRGYISDSNPIRANDTLVYVFGSTQKLRIR